MNHRILLALFIILSFSSISAQEIFRRFSTDIEKYPEELGVFMGTETAELVPEAIQSFVQRWIDGSIPDTNKAEFILISNQLLDNYARPRPHFMTFLEVIHLFSIDSGQADNQHIWINSMIDFTGPSNLTLPVIQDYMMFARNLLRSGIISQTNSTRWISSSRGFRLEYTDSVRLHVDGTDLTCYAVRDSIMILQTGGVYNPISHYWEGQGGRITWDRSGYNPDRIYAELDSYSVNFRLSEFKIDTVSYYNKEYFDFPIPGKLEHRAERIISGPKANYPRFVSFLMDYVIEDISQNVDYSGGISLGHNYFWKHRRFRKGGAG